MPSARRAPAIAPRRRVLALVGAAFVAAPAWATPRVYIVTIHDMAFGPVPASLRVGDVVEWVNADIFRHTATARDGSFDVDLAPKARVRTTLTKAGVAAFYCRYHPGMTGRFQIAR
jgi:plastocyanin